MAGESSIFELESLLQRMRKGEPAALEELIRHLGDRLQRLTRQMLKGHPAVKRWAETDDVLQGALIRLVRAVRTVQPDSLRSFFGLAAQQIRRELIDLARHFYGPEGEGANHATHAGDDEHPGLDQPDLSDEPGSLTEWCEFHQKIDALPEEEREVVDLLYYEGLTQADAAELLHVSVRTVQRRWHAALLKLHDSLQGQRPE